MRSSRVIHIVGCHCEGEVGDVIVGGVAPPPGETVWDQSRFIARDQKLRNLVLNEPRGGVFRHVNLLVPPKHKDAHTGWIIMEPVHTPPMSGSNSICVATVLLETGIVAMVEPETRVLLEAPGGLVEAIATCHRGKVESVRVRNVASFAAALATHVEVEGIGTLTVDTAYGGDSFVLVGAEALGLRLTADEALDLASMGVRITSAANAQIGFRHPTNPGWSHISFCQFIGPVTKERGIQTGRSAVAIEPGKIDRSPCGTGCSARMAVMHARGQLATGERYIGVSPIDSRFHCRIESETEVGGLKAIVPSIAGQAWITAATQLLVDPTDPWPEGYRLSDTWPMSRRM